MLRKVLIGNYNPQNDGLNGSFWNIIKKTSNLNKNFVVSRTNSNTTEVAQCVLIFGNKYIQSYSATDNPFFSITLKHHLIQITEFAIGIPTDSCYSKRFLLYGTDENNEEVLLGDYLSSEYNFCGSQDTCQGSGSVTFDIKEKSTKLFKNIKFVSVSGSCHIIHLAVKGVEVYGNLFQRFYIYSIRCKKSLPNVMFLLMFIV